MPRIATRPETIIAAAVDVIQNANVFPGAVDATDYVFAVDDPDETVDLGSLLQDFAVGVWMKSVEQAEAFVSSEQNPAFTPWTEGELVVTVWVRHGSDQAGRATAAISDTTSGTMTFLRKVVAALNEKELAVGPDNILYDSLTFLRWRYMGRLRGEDLGRWRRYDVSFDVTFNWAVA